ncbi:MAG: DUF3179 domain-containing (seleno)protein, partial [Phycisphaerae bacterium]
MTTPAPSLPPRRPLTWKNGGWLLALLALLCLGSALSVLFIGPHHQGDGQHIESYGFNLSNLTVPKVKIIAGGMPRDYLQALDSPPTLGPADLEKENAKNPYRKFLLPHDRVIGVVIGNEARAYPLNSLIYHEIINDTLAGRPIVVTYHALCDSAVVFDAKPVTIFPAPPYPQTPLQFRVSGLLYNSNLLMYDASSPNTPQESLWSQLEARAISGPRVGTPLSILACAVTTWEIWLHDHPHTRIMAPDPAAEKPLAGISYTNYFSNDSLKFPVDPAWNPQILPHKTPILAVRFRDAAPSSPWHVYALPKLAALDPAARAAALTLDGV